MKKVLLTVLIILISVLLGYTVVKGWNIGSIKVLSFNAIRDKDAKLEAEVQKANRLVDKDYNDKLKEQDINIENLEEVKKQYEDLVVVNVEDGAEPTGQLQKYEMEYLWAQIGNHAKQEGVTLKIDVSKSFEPNNIKQETKNDSSADTTNDNQNNNTTNTTNTTNTSNSSSVKAEDYVNMEAAVVSSTSTEAEENEDLKYDISFEATGGYVAVADFIYSIENDSTLGFKIENFKMIKDNTDSTGYVVGMFKCKGIRIKKMSQTTEEQQENAKETGNTTNNTTSDTTNSNRTSNSTNTSNTTR